MKKEANIGLKKQNILDKPITPKLGMESLGPVPVSWKLYRIANRVTLLNFFFWNIFKSMYGYYRCLLGRIHIYIKKIIKKLGYKWLQNIEEIQPSVMFSSSGILKNPDRVMVG